MKPTPNYFRNLDALRSICFLMVFFFHSFTTKNQELYHSEIYTFIKSGIFGNGNLGVTFFFVLSGFLITYLLTEEKKISGKIHVLNFWFRRILRIWPLYFTCLFIGFVLFPLAKQLMHVPYNETAHVSAYLYFGSNFDFIHNGRPDASILGVLWSISIEEQFYLIWPLILLVFPLKRWWIPITLTVALSFIFRIYHPDYLNREFHTFSCMNDLAIGSLIGWLSAYTDMLKSPNFPKWSWISYWLFLTLFFFKDELEVFAPYDLFSRLITSLVISGIILHQAKDSGTFKLAKFKILSRLGKYTYGLYSLHFLGILITITITQQFLKWDNTWSVLLLDTILSLFLSLVLAYLSYRYLESPFLRLKKKFTLQAFKIK